jgi:hypothetical protein
MSIDLKLGGTIELQPGRVIEIPPHSQRVFGELWGNGAFIEVLFYDEPQPDQDPSDRIHLLITQADGKRRGWLMNVEDANSIIGGLSVGIRCALEKRVPCVPLAALFPEWDTPAENAAWSEL